MGVASAGSGAPLDPRMSRPNDEPTLHDFLGREAMVHEVADQVAHDDPPLVVGIHGDWGSGKTSFLHQLQFHLTGDCPQQGARRLETPPEKDRGWDPVDNVTAIWFEAWRYQHEPSPVVALLQEIRAQLPLDAKLWTETKKLAEVSVQSALRAFESLTESVGIQATAIREEGERWERERFHVSLPSHAIRQQLEHAIATVLDGGSSGSGSGKRRLVVLIDDLDRCEPRAAYRLLEAIKIYLSLSNCVFVLGMDHRVIEGAVASQLPAPTSGGPALGARDYLEKLCQRIWYLPMPADPVETLGRWLGEDHVRADLVQAILAHLRAARALPANPRKLKAFANVLPRFACHVPKDVEDEALEREVMVMLIVACLYHFHPEIFRHVDGGEQFYNEVLLPWCEGSAARPHPALAALAPVETPGGAAGWEAAADDKRAVPSDEALATNFPDPALGNVLRIQPLIRRAAAVTEPELKRYLAGARGRRPEESSS